MDTRVLVKHESAPYNVGMQLNANIPLFCPSLPLSFVFSLLSLSLSLQIRGSITLDLVPVLPCSIQGLVVHPLRDLLSQLATMEIGDGLVRETRVLGRTMAEMG